MGIQWLLQEQSLGLRLLVPADDEDRQIRFAHAIELQDPSPWLTGGELVLTTGLRLPVTPTEQRAYVRRLADTNIAALGFGVGVVFDSVPSAIEEACREEHLPLIEVPLPTPFVAITQAVATRLADLQAASLKRLVTHQGDITKAALRDGVCGLMRRLRAELEPKLLLLNPDLSRLWPTDHDDSWFDSVAELVANEGSSRASISVAAGESFLWIQRLGGERGTLAWLAVNSTQRLEPGDRVLINHAVSMLFLLLERPTDAPTSPVRLGTTLLALLMESDPPCGIAAAVRAGLRFPAERTDHRCVHHDRTQCPDPLAHRRHKEGTRAGRVPISGHRAGHWLPGRRQGCACACGSGPDQLAALRASPDGEDRRLPGG